MDKLPGIQAMHVYTIKYKSIQFACTLLVVLLLAACIPQGPVSHTEGSNTALLLIREGITSSENQEYEDALQKFTEALETIGDDAPMLEADLYYRIGRIHLKQQRYKQSLSTLQQSLALVKKFGSPHDQAMVQSSIGNAYQSLGLVEAAREHYLDALAIRRESEDKQGQVRVLINLGSTYLAQGKYAVALEYYENAQIIADSFKPPDPRTVGAIFTHMGSLYAELGQYDKALTMHQKALETYRNNTYKPGVATALHNIGFTNAEQGQYPEAIASFRQAVTLKEELQDQFGRADTLNSLGFTLAEAGQPTGALQMLEEALQILEDLNAAKQVAATLDSIGTVYRQLGDYPEALDYFNRSLTLFRQLGDRDGERISLGNIGSVLALQDKIDPAIIFYKMSVNITQAIRRELVNLSPKEQKAYAKRIEDNYRSLANLLIDRGRLLEAEEILAMLKEEEYFNFMRRRSDAADTATTTATLSEAEREWAERYAEINRKLIAIGQEYEELRARKVEDLSTEEKLRLEKLKRDRRIALEAFDRYLQELTNAFSSQNSERAREFGEKELEILTQVQADLKSLGPGSILIHYLVTDDRLRILITTPLIQLHRDSQITWKELNNLIASFRESLQNPTIDPHPQAEILYQYLVEPLEGDLQQADAHTLMLSLDDTLRYLPFAALYDGEQYLSERYALAVYTAAARRHLTTAPQQDWKVTGLGVSEGAGNEFGPLPAVLRELNYIVREDREDDTQGVLAGVVRLNNSFTADQLSNDLREGYPVVHIASHFKFRPGNDTDSYLLLGSHQKLSLADIKYGDYPLTGVDLLSLSACETAYGGRDAHGREIESFGVLAQQRGAKAVLATLWPVNDASTADFMAAFYRHHLEGMTKAEALRQTQVEFLQGKKNESMIDDTAPEDRQAEVLDTGENEVPFSAPHSYAHPYFWAPFILMGNFL